MASKQSPEEVAKAHIAGGAKCKACRIEPATKYVIEFVGGNAFLFFYCERCYRARKLGVPQ